MLKEDKVLEILRAPPRTPRKHAVQVHIESGRYTLTVDNRVVASAAGTAAQARAAARDKADSLKRLTRRTYHVEEFT